MKMLVLLGLFACLAMLSPTPTAADCGKCKNVTINEVEQHHWEDGETHECPSTQGGHSSECQYYHMGTCNDFHASCVPDDLEEEVELAMTTGTLDEFMESLSGQGAIDDRGRLKVWGCGGDLIGLLEPDDFGLSSWPSLN
jgi:hypothetical protein